MIRNTKPLQEHPIVKPRLKFIPAGNGRIKKPEVTKINPNDSTVKRKCARRYNKINELQKQIRAIQEQIYEGVEPIYKKDTHPALAFSYCLLGCKDARLAELLGISEVTLREWAARDEEFAIAIKEGRDVANANVAKSMYHRACGYEVEEKEYRAEFIKDPEGNILRDEDGNLRREIVLSKVVKKQVPADVAAGKFYLWNRTKTRAKDEQWTDRQDIDVTSGDKPMLAAVVVLPQKEAVI